VTSNADRNVFAQAVVLVTSLPAVSVVVSPQSVNIAPESTTRFTAKVEGTRDTRVMWSADSGVILQDGTWTAPDTSGTFHITVQSIADPTKTASAIAAVYTTGVTVSVEPDQVTLSAGGPGFQFKAPVTGSPDTAVTWSVQQP
jgi:hypothetical protein